MSSLWNRHPEAQLLPFLDGELSDRQASRVARHLEGCDACRLELGNLRSVLADCAEYHQAPVPAPPAEWRDLHREFSRIDESLAHEPLLVRLARSLVHAGAPRWAMAAAMATLVVTGVFYQLRHTPSVQAATLLKRAVTVAESRPRPTHKVRFHTSKQDFTRIVGPQAPVAQAAMPSDIAALFAQAHYDLTDPFSARAFTIWRDSLPSKTDQVTETTQPAGETYQITTESADNEIAEASITLGPDYEPTAERVEFRNHEFVEMNEISETLTENNGTTVAPSGGVPVRAAEPPSRPAAFAPGPSASIADELQVFLALRKIGADLGDPIEVSLSGGKVLVSGAGISASRQQQIEARLRDLPRVELQFAAAQPSPAAATPSPVESAGGTPTPAIQSKVEKQVGGKAKFEQFSSKALDLDDAIVDRVHALRTLAQKFPADSESQLTAADRESLLTLSREHAAVLSESLSALDNLLQPTLASLGGTAAMEAHPAHHAAWQSATEDVVRSADRVNHLVSAILGASPSDISAARLPSELLSALKDLRSNVNDVNRLVAR